EPSMDSSICRVSMLYPLPFRLLFSSTLVGIYFILVYSIYFSCSESDTCTVLIFFIFDSFCNLLRTLYSHSSAGSSKSRSQSTRGYNLVPPSSSRRASNCLPVSQKNSYELSPSDKTEKRSPSSFGALLL